VVFFLETKNSKSEMEATLHDLDDFFESFVDAIRRAEGLVVRWDKKVIIVLLSYCLYHIDAFVSFEGEDSI